MARVLLIDDDQANLDCMRQMMQIEGHELVWAADGEQGLALLRQLRSAIGRCLGHERP